MKMNVSHNMVRAKVYRQDPPVECGHAFVDGARVAQWAAQLTPIGDVTGVTAADCWRRAYSLTRLPVMEWVRS
jgi:hypothetical protein